jgi:hypothetical protein
MDFIIPKYHKNRNQQFCDNICIPRIEQQTSLDYIKNTLTKLGQILHIREMTLYNEPDYKRVLICIIWSNTIHTNKIVERLQNGNNIKIIYKEPWYWKIILDRKGNEI